MAQGNTWVDGVPAGDAEDLQVCVVTVALIALHGMEGMMRPDRPRYWALHCRAMLAHLLILSHSLLLGTRNDGLKLMESALHFLKAGAGILLLPADAFKELLAMLFSNAGALLPLLDALGKDLVDATAGNSGAGRNVASNKWGEPKMTKWMVTKW